jgi:hypothetical protein
MSDVIGLPQRGQGRSRGSGSDTSADSVCNNPEDLDDIAYAALKRAANEHPNCDLDQLLEAANDFLDHILRT